MSETVGWDYITEVSTFPASTINLLVAAMILLPPPKLYCYAYCETSTILLMCVHVCVAFVSTLY